MKNVTVRDVYFVAFVRNSQFMFCFTSTLGLASVDRLAMPFIPLCRHGPFARACSLYGISQEAID